ncbi:MAG TPA: hypothetical protein VM143_14255 [Acidimicrobiales bacterium]|nr:hypothetical protein [Acidimicrobiales bacterium]
MTLFAFASSHGAPGVTATVMGLAAAWPATTGRDVLVIEADPDGGVLATRFEELRADRTLADVAVDVRRSFDIDAVLGSARQVWGGVPVVVAPPSAEQTHSALSAGGDALAAGLAASDSVDVLVDVGRLTVRSPALHLARRALSTIFVTRPTFEAAASLAARVPEVAAHGCDPGLVLVGDQPYPPRDFELAVGVPLIGLLPHDRRAAVVFAGGPGSERHVRRSLLWRSLGDLASRLVARVDVPTDGPLQSHAPRAAAEAGRAGVAS